MELLIVRCSRTANATKLADMCNDVVFLGGCTTGLFITDPVFPDVRYTLLEAFKTRGKMDFYASHDFEDSVSILDGQLEIVEIRVSNHVNCGNGKAGYYQPEIQKNIFIL